jgi:hypothetical protein
MLTLCPQLGRVGQNSVVGTYAWVLRYRHSTELDHLPGRQQCGFYGFPLFCFPSAVIGFRIGRDFEFHQEMIPNGIPRQNLNGILG